MSDRRGKQEPATPIHMIIWQDSGSNDERIVGARYNYIRATKIVNKLNEWTVDKNKRRDYRQGRMVPRAFYSQPYYVDSLDVR